MFSVLLIGVNLVVSFICAQKSFDTSSCGRIRAVKTETHHHGVCLNVSAMAWEPLVACGANAQQMEVSLPWGPMMAFG